MARSRGTGIDEEGESGVWRVGTPPDGTRALNGAPGGGQRVGKAASVMAIAGAGLLAIGLVLLLLLPAQWFAAYFTIWMPVKIDDSEIRLYELTASGCLLLLGASALLGLLARRRAMALVAAVLFAAALVAALVFAVPQNRWMPEVQKTAPLPADYDPCYSGSDDCSGGG